MKLVALLLLFLLIASSIAHAVSIGVSPARLSYANLLRDGYAEKRFTLSTSSEETVFGHFQVTGDIRDWIRFGGNTTSFNLSASSPAIITIAIVPPPDTPVGTYTGQVAAIADSVGSLSGRAGSVIQTSVALSISVQVTGDEINSCKAGAFEFRDVEQGKPLELWLTIENEGNVRTSPLITFDLFDKERTSLLLTDTLQSVPILPTVTQRFFLQSQNTLPPGQYWAALEVPECDAATLLTFSVVERGAIADKGELVEIRTPPSAGLFETIPVVASFINRGSRIVSAQFKTVVNKDGKIVERLESESFSVEPGENAQLEVFFTPQETGRYEITGKVVYNDKITFEKGVTLTVEGDESSKTNLPLALIAYLGVVIGIFFLLRKFRKRKRTI